MDTDVSGFGVRVTDKGKRTFFLLARYPGSDNPTRRAVGEYPTNSLADAHKKARKWRDWIKEAKDPKDEEESLRLAVLRKNADIIDVVADLYIKRLLTRQRRGGIVAKENKREFSDRWKGRAITSITRRDIIEVSFRSTDNGAH